MGAPIPDYSKVSLLLPMTGSNGGTTFTDHSPSPKTVTRGGNTLTVTDQSQYYGSSAYFDGAGGYLQAADSQFAFGTGDWAIAVSSRFAAEDFPASTQRGLASTAIQSTSAPWGIALYVQRFSTGDFALYAMTGWNTYGSRWLLPAGVSLADAWHRYEFFCVGGVLGALLDGVLMTPELVGGGLAGRSLTRATLRIGTMFTDVTTNPNRGYMQDAIVTAGGVLHTASYTPSRLIGSISVETRDESGILVPRKVFAVPRSYPSIVKASGTTDASGALTLTGLPACEYSVVAIADGDTLPDLVLRRLPT